jgi:hypothetical protein
LDQFRTDREPVVVAEHLVAVQCAGASTAACADEPRRARDATMVCAAGPVGPNRGGSVDVTLPDGELVAQPLDLDALVHIAHWQQTHEGAVVSQ